MGEAIRWSEVSLNLQGVSIWAGAAYTSPAFGC